MASHLGPRGWRVAVSARVAMIVGIVCVTALVVTVPAMADDDSNSGSPDSSGTSGQSSQSSRDDDTLRSSDSTTKQDPNLVAGTPCTKTARACVDLDKQRAWLIDPAAKVTRGPVPISSGGPGEETPTGTFAVRWKDKNHVSTESKNEQGQPAPMPFSVFFTPGGVAFHGGSVTRASAGCVHLDDDDAQAFYSTLKLGDQVQVH